MDSAAHLMILKYAEIQHLNISYFTLEFDPNKEEFVPRQVE